MKERVAAAGQITLDTIAGFQRNQASLMAAGLAYYLLISFYFASYVVLLGAQFAKTCSDHRC